MEKNINYNKVMVNFLKKVIDQLNLETCPMFKPREICNA